MTLQDLRKKVIIKGAVILAIALAILGFALYVDGMKTDAAKDLRKAENNTRVMNTDIQKLDDKFQKAQSFINLYRQLKKNTEEEQGVNRKQIARVLRVLRDRYHLSGLTLEMSPVSQLEGKEYASDHFTAEHTLVHLKFGGMTDEFLMAFVDNLLREMPGHTRVDQLSITRIGQMDERFFTEVSREQYPALVEGEMSFHWIGLRQKAKDKPEEGRNGR